MTRNDVRRPCFQLVISHVVEAKEEPVELNVCILIHHFHPYGMDAFFR